MELHTAIRALKKNGIANAPMEARLLARLAKHNEELKNLVARRSGGEPYSRIAGKREFWSMEFTLSPDVLDPRCDSEILIEQAQNHLPKQAPLKMLDLGCGSGCLGLAFLRQFKNAKGIAVDISPAALRVAQTNAVNNNLTHRIRFVASSWASTLRTNTFDVILANPPYIPTFRLKNLAPEVIRHDPVLALDGGSDGMAAYKRLLPQLAGLLKPKGLVFLEVGENLEAIIGLAHNNGLVINAIAKDYGGNYRCLIFTRFKPLHNRANYE